MTPAAYAPWLAIALAGCSHSWTLPATCRVVAPASRPAAEAVVGAASETVSRATSYLTCRGGSAALFRVTYATHDAAEASVPYWGKSLFGAEWTGGDLLASGPDDDIWIHDREIAIASGPGRADLGLSLERVGYLDRVSDEVHDLSFARQATIDLDCSATSRDPARAWCPLAGLGSEPFTAPASAKVLIGLSLHVRPGQTIHSALASRNVDLRVSTFALDSRRAVLRDILPQNADERAQLATLTDAVRAVLEHRASRITVSPALAKFVAGQRAEIGPTTSETKPARRGVEVQGTLISRAYRSGAAYLVLETAFEDGNWINVYPDVEPTAAGT